MTRPNIVWLVADHQAHANRGVQWSQLPLQGRLGAEGLRFERAYTPLPICSPARASMLTGRYPHAHGLTENDGRFGGRSGLDPTDWLVHHPLTALGYRSAWFGKWHVDNTRSAADYGFEGFSLPGYGYPYATSEYRHYLDRRGLKPPAIRIEQPGESGLPPGTRVDLCSEDSWFDFEAGTARLESPHETHEAFFVADLACEWLAAARAEPFFLRVDAWGPHPPYTLSDAYARLFEPSDVQPPANLTSTLAGRPAQHRDYRDYWRKTLGLDEAGWRLMAARSLAHVALVESALVRVVDTIDHLGLGERTLVVFTADHGDAIASNGGVANKGELMVEETLRVPMLIRGPGIPTGRMSRSLVSSLDIAPTLLELAGVSTHESHGVSLAPLLEEPTRPVREALMTQHYGLHTPIVQRACHAGHYKLVVQEDGFTELYDLRADPCELTNVADSLAHGAVRAELGRQLYRLMTDTGDDDPRVDTILATL